MSKIKWALIAIAITVSIGGAFATKQTNCEDYPQYYQVGSSYQPAGVYGYDYFCWNTGGICTYYKPNPFVEVYYPCRTGAYQVIPH